MRRSTVLFLLWTAGTSLAQSSFDAAKSRWLANDGALLDGDANGASKVFARMENGKATTSEITAFVNDLMGDESWQGGNRGSGLIALQLCLWEKSRLPAADYQRLWARLLDLAGDQYYYGVGWSNTGINCMAVHYIMAQFLPAGTMIRYDDPPNVYGMQNFTFAGKTYERGKTYPLKELAQNWLYAWMLKYVNNEYLHGELFSETYSYHFLNCLITLADSRMTLDVEMRRRAAMTADIFLLEHGINANGHHLSGPLGRTYMISHLTGQFFFFPFDAYFSGPYPTPYGHSGSYYVSDYRLPAQIETIVKNLPHSVESNVQEGRYAVVTDKYTLGSGPDGGNWTLEINSNDPGPYPKARPGFNFRLWLNSIAGDLDMGTCSGECYAEMGQGAYQYKNSMLVSRADLKLHEALISGKWDRVENTSGWRFSEENGVGVAINLQPNAGALEVSYLGKDETNYDAFKNAVLAKAQIISTNKYITRRGEKIENRNGKTFVNDQSFNQNLPRLLVVDTNGNRSVSSNNMKFTVGSLTYDFNGWTTTLPPRDTVAPAIPSNLKILN